MGVQTLEYIYKEITLFRQWQEQGLAANSRKYLPVKKQSEILLRFCDTYIYY